MFKKLKLNLPNTTRLKLKFSDFAGGINTTVEENLLPIRYAKMSYNTNFKDHALKNGIGFKELSLQRLTTTDSRVLDYTALQGNIDGVWVFEKYDSNNNRADLIFLHCDNNEIYYQPLYCDYNQFAYFVGFTYSGKPTVLVHKYQNSESAILVSESDYLAIWTGYGAPAKVANTLNLTSICMHYERLFATVGGKKNLVRFSDNFNIAEWDETPTEGGFIELVDERGQCNKVISFNDYVYIIREHGISKLSAYGEQTNFSISHLFLCADKIYDNTAVLCGDKIVMACSDGLYYFNGYTATKYNLKINEMFVREYLKNAVACYFNGKYYLSCRLDFKDEIQVGVENSAHTNNALVEFDIKTGEYIITRGVDVIHLFPIVDNSIHKLAIIFGDSTHRKIVGELTNDGKFFGTPLPKNWTSPQSDFGYPERQKIVREIHILTKYDISLTVKSESESRIINIKGSDKTQIVSPNVKGKRIGLSFDSVQNDFYVSNPNVIVDLL